MGKDSYAGQQRREMALAALTECDTLTAAAKQAGISRSTMWQYLKEREFCEQLRAMKEQHILERATAATSARQMALDTLTDVMGPGMPPQVRVKAAKIVLDDANAAISAALAVYETAIDRYNSAGFLKSGFQGDI